MPYQSCPILRDTIGKSVINFCQHEKQLRDAGKTLLVVFDALDTVATNWPRRRLLTEALLEVVWAMRAYGRIKLKLFCVQTKSMTMRYDS
jgi:hypothetical protein